MKLSRMNIMSLVLVLATFAVAAWYYPALPDPVPTHWSAAGEVDGWTEKPWGVWLIPLITLATTAVMLVLPAISPKGFRLDAARRAYDIVVFMLVAFMLAVELFAFRAALHGGGGLTQIVPVAVGFLLIALGNYLGKFPKNFFVGIRTPWTLASDQVWNRTHRLAGYLFMAAGVVVLLTGFLEAPAWLLIAVVTLAALIPALYSLFLYRRLHGFSSEPDNDD